MAFVISIPIPILFPIPIPMPRFTNGLLNPIEIIRDKKKKRPDIDAIHDYIMKTKASNKTKEV